MFVKMWMTMLLWFVPTDVLWLIKKNSYLKLKFFSLVSKLSSKQYVYFCNFFSIKYIIYKLKNFKSSTHFTVF